MGIITPKINKHMAVDLKSAILADCPSKVTATLVGAASGWLTADNAKIYTGLTTSTSDGYKLTIAITGVRTVVLADTKFMGGCVQTATSNSMCIHAEGAYNCPH